jgi:nucleotide-binding universal stress UspA family protein
VEKAVNSKYPDSFVLAKHLAEEAGRRELKLKALMGAIEGIDTSQVEIVIGNGIPYVEIIAAINREKIDFLVFGSKGETNLIEFLFGSVAEKLFRHSPVPVMSLRTGNEAAQAVI